MSEQAIINPQSTGNMRWYVIHAYSGMEKSVQKGLTERIARSALWRGGMQHRGHLGGLGSHLRGPQGPAPASLQIGPEPTQHYTAPEPGACGMKPPQGARLSAYQGCQLLKHGSRLRLPTA